MRYKIRAKIFKRQTKENLKENGLVLPKNLTKNRMEQLKRVREEQSFQKAWSKEKEILHIDVNKDNRVNVFYD